LTHERQARYTGVAIALHWIVALLMIAGFALGLTMVGMRFSPAKLKYFSWHKWLGVTVFLLALLRLLWRLRFPAPPPPENMQRWQIIAAKLSHALLYVLMLVIPISGWLFSSADGVPVVYFGLIALPDLVAPNKALAETLKSVHHSLNWVLLAAVIVHVAAALEHHFIARDDILRRMLPRFRRAARSQSAPDQLR
jgi:cytochrome b561